MLNRLFYSGLGLVLFVGCLPAETENSPVQEPEHAMLFRDVTESAGLESARHHTGAIGDKWMPETYGAGVAFVDYNGDGWQDILFVNGGEWAGPGIEGIPALRLFENQSDGRFREVTEETGLDAYEAYGFGVAAADFDNDGDADILLTTLSTNLFFRNDDGHFTEVGKEVGLAGYQEWSTAALFFDADRDGWVDLYLGHYVPWTPETDIACTSDGTNRDYCMPHQYQGAPARFYRNTGKGTFVERTTEAGLNNNPGKTLGVVSLDFNRDMWPDFIVANDTYPNLLYQNKGDGTFEEVGLVSGVAYDNNGRARAGMGIDAGVVDTSGGVSVVVGNFSEEMAGVFQHQGNGIFRDRAPASGIGGPSLMTLTFGVSLLDVDLDGDLDAFFVNGHILEQVEEMQDGVTYRQPPQLFLNDGAGRFALLEERPVSVMQERYVGRGLAYADYDHDGDLDLLITENGGPLHLWQNTTNPHERADVSSLRLTLTGETSTAEALGASVVTVSAGTERQYRRVHTGGSYLSQSEQTLTFGFRNAAKVDSIRVVWPSGRVDVFTDVPVDQSYNLREGQTMLH